MMSSFFCAKPGAKIDFSFDCGLSELVVSHTTKVSRKADPSIGLDADYTLLSPSAVLAEPVFGTMRTTGPRARH